jgi:hypothetical protein
MPDARLMIITAVALLCAGNAACTGYEPEATPPGISSLQDQRRAAIDRLRADTLRPLTLWQQETPPSCNSPSLAKASVSARMTASMLSPERQGIDTVIEGGSWMLEVADAARDHGCKDAARRLYDAVIGTYTGSAYAALRQRAQIGIDDLRQ